MGQNERAMINTRWLPALIFSRLPLLGLLCLPCLGKANATEIRRVGMMRDDVLMLEIVAGKATPPTLGNGRNGKVTDAAFRTEALPENFSLSSADHEDYADGVSPEEVGRKSKPHRMVRTGDWAFGASMLHRLYLKFAEPLEAGARYTVVARGLCPKELKFGFVFEPAKLRSDAIHVNQIGFVPAAHRKFAYLGAWLGDMGTLKLDDYVDETFKVVDTKTGEAVLQGEPVLRKRGTEKNEDALWYKVNLTLQDVYALDLSELKRPGEYRIVVPRMGCSFAFRVGDDVYQEAFHTACRGLYHQRCGIHLESAYTNWPRPKPCHRGPVIRSNCRWADTSMGPTGKGPSSFVELPGQATGERIDVWGGYHDAGDWDRRAQHLIITDKLLWLFELSPKSFYDGQLRLPESGNGLPDLVDEARWNLDFWSKLQGPDGGVGGGIESEAHPKVGETATTDTLHLYAFASDEYASLRYAASACEMSRATRALGRDKDRAHFLRRALNAWQYAAAHGGEQHRDQFAYTAAQLYKTTGEARYQEAYARASVWSKDPGAPLFAWQKHNQRQSAYIYASTDQPNLNKQLHARVRSAVLREADAYIDFAKRRAYGFVKDPDTPTGWGAASGPNIDTLIWAFRLTGDEEYRTWIYTTADYFLGGNPLNTVWVTGLGDNPVREVMHLESWYDGIEEPVPGLVPGGPHRETDTKHRGGHGFALRLLYPPPQDWPQHEMFFGNRHSPQANEVLPDSAMLSTILCYGFLCPEIDKPPAVQATTPLPELDPEEVPDLAKASTQPGEPKLLPVQAKAHVTGIEVVSNTLLAVRFDSSLDVRQALRSDLYLIRSEDDEDYRLGALPVRVGRRSRAAKLITEGWPMKPIPEHIIYAALPKPLQSGKRYTLTVRNALKTEQTHPITFEESRLRSPAIKVNQLGYLPDAAKLAYLGLWCGTLGPVEFRAEKFNVVAAETGETVFNGAVELRKESTTRDEDAYKLNLAGENVYDMDFSEVTEPGSYFIVVPGVGRSYEFSIRGDIYGEAFRTSIRGLYHQRCGIELKMPYTRWTHPACHRAPVTLSTTNLWKSTNVFRDLPRDATQQKARLWGGYHDAGDYDRRAQHFVVPDLLLSLYEMRPEVFTDGQQNIPESGNGVPDIVDEARWGLDFFARLQDEDGGVRGGIESHTHPTGRDAPHRDRLPYYAYGKDVKTSFMFAGNAAKAARVYRSLARAEEADHFLVRAESAWRWAVSGGPKKVTQEAEDEEPDGNDAGLGMLEKRTAAERAGGAEDPDDCAFAAAELFKTTGKDEYHKMFVKYSVFSKTPKAELAVYQKYDQHAAGWAYATCKQPGTDGKLREHIRRAFIREADTWLAFARRRSYRFSKHPWAPIGYGGGAGVNGAIPLIRAFHLTDKKVYREWALLTADHHLGCNPLGLVWTTGLGQNPVRAPLHIHSMTDDIAEPVPGISVYGPRGAEQGRGIHHTAVQPAFYPDYNTWPSLYLYADVWYDPAINEFTVQESIAPTAFVLGFFLPD